MKYIKESSYKLHNDFCMNGYLIKEASELTYQHTSNKTIDDFVKMLLKNKHYAMLEFSWYVVEIPLPSNNFNLASEMMHYYNSKKYLNCSVERGGLVVSGNGRAWYEILKEEKTRYENLSIIFQLKKINPSLFNFNFTAIEHVKINILAKEEIQNNNEIVTKALKVKTKEDRNKHDWIAVTFDNVSRGFTHEIVRHRTLSFAQTSTRRIPMKDFSIVIDGLMMNNSVDYKKIDDCMKNVQETYNYLLHRGYKKDEIRQILPIGVAGQIIVAGNIQSWKNMFELRTAKDAHWEIRLVMNDLRENLIDNGYIF